MFLFFGIMNLLFPKQFLEMFGFAQEPLTTVLQAVLAWAGTLSICWAIAIGIALRNVLGSRSLVQAIVVLQLIMGAVGFYFDFFVLKQTGAAISDLLFILLGVVLLVLYPRKEQANIASS